MKNTRVIFAKRPTGEPDDSCFRLEQARCQSWKMARF